MVSNFQFATGAILARLGVLLAVLTISAAVTHAQDTARKKDDDIQPASHTFVLLVEAEPNQMLDELKDTLRIAIENTKGKCKCSDLEVKSMSRNTFKDLEKVVLDFHGATESSGGIRFEPFTERNSTWTLDLGDPALYLEELVLVCQQGDKEHILKYSSPKAASPANGNLVAKFHSPGRYLIEIPAGPCVIDRN